MQCILPSSATRNTTPTMEDNDDYQPDSAGYLDLKYRGWTDLQPIVWSFTHALLHLDISFNSLQTLPNEISSLNLLQELNCSCNKLQSIPETIGSLPWLRIIKANGNQITTIPKEIGNCKTLEQLNLGENQLTSLPQEIDGCTVLRSLLLQNNDLSRLPLSLSLLSGHLRDLDLTNNNSQLETTIPKEIHRDVYSIMWILGLQREKRHCIDRLKQDVKMLQHDNIVMEGELSEARDRVAMLEEKKRGLQHDMESVEYFLILRLHVRRFRRWALRMWLESKRAFSSRLHDRI